MMNCNEISQNVRDYCDYYLNLTPQTVDQLSKHTTKNFTFSDPFHESVDLETTINILKSMFLNSKQVKFYFEECYQFGPLVYLKWRCRFLRLSGKPLELNGVSRLIVNDNGLIEKHEDFWDAAKQIYEHMPIIGCLTRYIRKNIITRYN